MSLKVTNRQTDIYTHAHTDTGVTVISSATAELKKIYLYAKYKLFCQGINICCRDQQRETKT